LVSDRPCTRVPHRRRGATTNLAAGQAEPQMYPGRAQSKAVLAALRSARPDGPDQGKVGIGQDRLRCIAHVAEHRRRLRSRHCPVYPATRRLGDVRRAPLRSSHTPGPSDIRFTICPISAKASELTCCTLGILKLGLGGGAMRSVHLARPNRWHSGRDQRQRVPHPRSW
jgi:hypothetical protein